MWQSKVESALSSWLLPYTEVVTISDGFLTLLGLFRDDEDDYNTYLVLATVQGAWQVAIVAISYDQLAEIIALFHEAKHDGQADATWPLVKPTGEEGCLVFWQVDCHGTNFEVQWSGHFFNTQHHTAGFSLEFDDQQVDQFLEQADDFLIEYRPRN